MTLSKTNEQAFEWLIERALVGTTREEREAAGLTDVESQQPQDDQYYWGQPQNMDKKLALDLRRLWSFLEATQGDVLREYKGRDIRQELPRLLSKEIDTATGSAWEDCRRHQGFARLGRPEHLRTAAHGPQRDDRAGC